MQTKHTLTVITALLSAGLITSTLADTVSPSFFGASSNAPGKSAAAPTTTQAPALTKDQFLQQVTGLNAANQAQFQQNLNAQLKPLPSNTTPSTNTAAAPLPTTATNPSASVAPGTPAATTTPPPSDYTGFGAGTTPPTTTPTTPKKSSSGWNVTY